MSVRIGIDLGGTNLRYAVMADDGTILEERKMRTPHNQTAEWIIQEMITTCHSFMRNFDVRGIGIGAPGPLNAKAGIILDPPNLTGWEYVPIVQQMEKALGTTVNLNNDANAAALAEATFGAGKDSESMYYVTVSTGVGGGFVFRNQLISGANSCAGEVGNLFVNESAPTHTMMNDGCLELCSSGSAITASATEVLEDVHHAGNVFEQANKGNEKAQEIIQAATDALAKGLANIVHTVDPEMIVLGGGVMQSGDDVLPLLKEKLPSYVFPQIAGKTELLPAALGTNAGVIGAALLIS
ncbi:MAG: ROK family protein [Bacilli bacterium]